MRSICVLVLTGLQCGIDPLEQEDFEANIEDYPGAREEEIDE